MMRRLAAVGVALLYSLTAHAQPGQTLDAATPAFDCQRASKAVEQWICTTPALALADQQLSQVYFTAQSKPDDHAALSELRRTQLRWLRERNRCETPDCVATSYARRMAALEATNARVLRVQGHPFEPVFSRTVPSVNDTRVIPGIALQRTQATVYQVELYTNPKDVRRWARGGPGARIACWPPDRQEGYASRFQYAARSWGDAFRKIERDGRPGYVLLRFVVGKDLPLHEDIRCTVALTEWLLDHPSELHVVPLPN